MPGVPRKLNPAGASSGVLQDRNHAIDRLIQRLRVIAGKPMQTFAE